MKAPGGASSPSVSISRAALENGLEALEAHLWQVRAGWHDSWWGGSREVALAEHRRTRATIKVYKEALG